MFLFANQPDIYDIIMFQKWQMARILNTILMTLVCMCMLLYHVQSTCFYVCWRCSSLRKLFDISSNALCMHIFVFVWRRPLMDSTFGSECFLKIFPKIPCQRFKLHYSPGNFGHSINVPASFVVDVFFFSFHNASFPHHKGLWVCLKL